MPRTIERKFTIRADSSDANQKLDTTARKIENLSGTQGKQAASSRRSSAANAGAQKSFTGLGTAATGAGVALGNMINPATLVASAIAASGAAAIASVRQFAEFEKSLAEVSTLIAGTPEQLAGITSAIQSLGIRFGTDQVTAARAYYQAISAGATAGAEANALLESAVKASIGGVTDIETATDGLTTVLNAYGLSAEHAALVSDQMFQAVRDGKTTFPELAASLGDTVTIASSLGVPFEVVAAGIAQITTSGNTTSKAVTQFRSILETILKPTAQAAQAAEELGVQWNEEGLQARGLSGLIEDLVVATGGSNTAIGKVIPTTEALNGVLSLARNRTKDFADGIDRVANSAGATEDAVDKLSQTTTFQFNRLTNSYKVLSVAAGGVIADALGLEDRFRRAADGVAEFGYQIGLLPASVLNTRQLIEQLTSAFERYDREQDKASDSAKEVREEIAALRKELGESPKALSELQGLYKNLNDELERLESGARGGRAGNQRVADLEAEIDRLDMEIDRVKELNRVRGAFAEILRLEEEEYQKLIDAQNASETELEKLISAYGGLRREFEPVNTALVENEKITDLVKDRMEDLVEAGVDVTHFMNLLEQQQVKLNDSSSGVVESTSKVVDEYQKLLEAFNPALRIQREYEESVDRLQKQEELGLITKEQFIDSVARAATVRDQETDAINKQTTGVTELSEETKRLLEEYDPLGVEEQRHIDRLEQIAAEKDAGILVGEKYNDVLAEEEDLHKNNTDAINKNVNALGNLNNKLADAGSGAADAFSSFFESEGEDFLYNILVGDEEAFARQFEELGGQAGAAFGMAWGPVGSAIGRVVGEAIGEALSDAVLKAVDSFRDTDRVTVGVSAAGNPFSQLGAGDTVTSASGLRLTPQSRGAGAEGAQTAREMLATLLGIDQRLVDLFEQLGVIIDLTGVDLRTGRQRSRERPSAQHDPFGSVEIGEIDQSDIDGAANEFTLAFIRAVIDQLPRDLASQLSAATNMEEAFRILSDAVNPLLNGLSNSAQALYDTAYPLVRLQEENAQVLRDLRDARDAGIITEEEYGKLVELQGNIFTAAARKVEEANGTIFGVSGATQALLDQIYPLEALERTRASTLNRLGSELAAGVITVTQHERAVKAANEAYEEGANAISGVSEEVFELTSAHQGLLDRLDPLGALERKRANDLSLLTDLYRNGEITIEQFRKGFKDTTDSFQDSVRELSEGDQVITKLGQTTRDILDALRPLDKLERIRTERLNELAGEFQSGALTLEEYIALQKLARDAYTAGAKALEENTDAHRAFAGSSAEALYEQAFPLRKVYEDNARALRELSAAREAEIIVEADYLKLIELQREIFNDARQTALEAGGAIFDVSDATRALLDQLYPLEALERTRTDTIERLDKELRAGVITGAQYIKAVAATNKAYEDGVKAVNSAAESVSELTSAHKNLLDQLDPLGALERARQRDLKLLNDLYKAGSIDVDQYRRGFNDVNKTFRDGVRDYEEAQRVFTGLSQTTKDFLDELRPLEKLERERNERVSELYREYSLGGLSLEDYRAALEAAREEYRLGAVELKRNSDEYKAFVQTNTDALREQYDRRIEGLNAEADAVRASISLIDDQIDALDLASVTINQFIRGWNLFEQAWNLSEFGSDVRTLNGRFETATRRVRELASAGSFTAESASELANAMEIQRRTALDLAVAWLNLTSVLETTLGGLADRLEESLLSASELVALRSEEITDLRRQLDVSTTPEEVQRIINDIARSIQDVVDSYVVRETTGEDGQQQFATTAFGQDFVADSAEALRALVVQFAANLARTVQDEAQGVADRGQVDQALDDVALRDEIAGLPAKLLELENELNERRDELITREEDIADQFEQATQQFEDSVELFKGIADRMDFSTERNEATEKRLASSIGKFEIVASRQEATADTMFGAASDMQDASREFGIVVNTPIQVNVAATFREVNA